VLYYRSGIIYYSFNSLVWHQLRAHPALFGYHVGRCHLLLPAVNNERQAAFPLATEWRGWATVVENVFAYKEERATTTVVSLYGALQLTYCREYDVW